MALGDSYATLANLKSRLGVTDTNDDSALTEALSSASRIIEKYTGRQFNTVASVTARRYCPSHSRLVLVDDFSSSVGLIVKTDVDEDGTFETVWASTDYQLEPLDGVKDGVTGWPYWQIRAIESEKFWNPTVEGRATIEVTALWGWSAVPAPIKEACLALAEETYKMKDAPFGVAGFADFGAVRVRQNPKILALLQDYRRTALRVA